MAIWVKFDTNAVDQYLFQYYEDADNYIRLFYNNGDSRLTYQTQILGLGTIVDIDSDADITTGAWQQIMMVFDNTTGTSTMYINNTAQADTESLANKIFGNELSAIRGVV